MTEIKSMLRKYELRHTRSRADILQVFLNQEMALSEREVEEAILGSCDRVTVYRTLATFMDRGLLHKVLDDEGAMKYALCNHDCAGGHHQHDHVHFKCRNCGKTSCLDHVRIPTIPLPEGYRPQEVNMLMEGICPDCQA